MVNSSIFLKVTTTAIGICVLLWTWPARAATAEKNYSICYGQLVGEILPADDPQLKEIAAGRKTEKEACANLVDTLNPNSIAAKNPLSLTLLSRLNRLHSTFFLNNDFYRFDETFPMADIYDSEAPAYALSDNFLGDGKVSEVLSGKKQFFARRNADAKPVYFTTKKMEGSYEKLEDRKWQGTPAPIFIERGVLAAIELDQRHIEQPQQIRVIASQNNELKPHQGGGILGLPEYILLNTREGVYDGGMNSFRRYGDRIMRDVLCRALPVLNEDDVKELLEPASTLSFRKNTRCMACHATMDPIGGLIGHLDLPYSNFKDSKGAVQFLYLSQAKVPKPQTFMYRTNEGELINKPVRDLEDLGKTITGLDDFYWCFANRYFNFVSGRKVSYMGSDPYARGVADLAKKFKNHQSLRELLKESYALRFDLERQ